MPANVILILTDDQGPWAARCCGNEEIITPGIDRLAAEGVRLDSFFCTSPVCSPARASLMTGRLPSQHGVHDWLRGGNMPPDPAGYLDAQTCYTDILARHGYACGLSGKWHLGDSLRPQHGFAHWFAMPGGGSRYQDAEMIRAGRVQTCPGYLTDVITDDALAFIRAHRDRPFCLNVQYNAPHSPFTGHPRELTDLYADCPFRTIPAEAPHPWLTKWGREQLGNRQSLTGYFAAITGLDRGVGRIVDCLEELGLRGQTLVVFMSDNGYSCGQHGLFGKGNATWPLNMYEESVKVPCIFSQPGTLPRGLVSSAMASQYDFIHTLLEHLDLPPLADSSLPGRSFHAALTGQRSDAAEQVVVYDEYGPVRMIRTAEWKYVHRYPQGPHELYDLASDPGERRNVADEKSRQVLVRDLRARLEAWFARYVQPEMDGASLPVTGYGQMRPLGGAAGPMFARGD